MFSFFRRSFIQLKNFGFMMKTIMQESNMLQVKQQNINNWLRDFKTDRAYSFSYVEKLGCKKIIPFQVECLHKCYSQKTYQIETNPWTIVNNEYVLQSDLLADGRDLSLMLLSTESSVFMSEIIRERYS